MLGNPKALNTFWLLLTTTLRISQLLSKKFKDITMDNPQETYIISSYYVSLYNPIGGRYKKIFMDVNKLYGSSETIRLTCILVVLYMKI